MADLKIESLNIGSNIVLTLKESLTYQNCEELEAMFDHFIKQNKQRIILDLKGVPYLDSRALELLLKMNDTLKNRTGSLRVFGLNSVCHDTLIATRLIHVFHIYPDIQAALSAEIP
jgi:anti-sigma B factor antagonist